MLAICILQNLFLENIFYYVVCAPVCVLGHFAKFIECMELLMKLRLCSIIFNYFKIKFPIYNDTSLNLIKCICFKFLEKLDI